MAVEVASEIQTNQKPAEQVIFASFSDTHYGIPDDRYLSLDGLAERVEKANGLGAHMLLVVGDFTDNGKYEEARAVAEVLTGFQGEVITGTGNHENLGQRNLISRAFRRQGLEIMDGRAVIREINGLRLGIMVENGSISRKDFIAIENLHGDDLVHAFHKLTGDGQLRRMKRNAARLVDEGIDALIVARHVPPFVEQYSDGKNHTTHYQSHPEFAQVLMELPENLLVVVVSGHLHSFLSEQWGRREPWVQLRDNLYAANIAQPNMTRAGKDAFVFFTIGRTPEGVVFQPVTAEELTLLDFSQAS